MRCSRGYFYTSERTADGPRRVYHGKGEGADLIEELTRLRREERLERRRLELAELAADRGDADALWDALAPLDRLAETLFAAAMTAAGYHQKNRGRWRRRRA